MVCVIVAGIVGAVWRIWQIGSFGELREDDVSLFIGQCRGIGDCVGPDLIVLNLCTANGPTIFMTSGLVALGRKDW